MVSAVMLTDSTRKHLCRVEGLYDQNNTNPLLPYCARFLKMFQAPVKIAGNGLELVVSYFTANLRIFFAVQFA